jgi:nucleotide-binding universal stress UspA family protein
MQLCPPDADDGEPAMQIRNILVGYDDSAPAKRALTLAEDLAGRYGARVVIVTVLRPLDIPVDVMAPTETQVLGARRALEREADRIRGLGIRVVAFVEVGEPTRTLFEIAERLDIDLTILGRSGKGALARLMMGSVTTSLLHRTTKPIMVAP